MDKNKIRQVFQQDEALRFMNLKQITIQMPAIFACINLDTSGISN